jgi:2,3-bisphosphoglycerate-dependent phosphoglycerate mutase
MVYERTVPFFQHTILPHIQKGENVIMVSHGNAIRAIMKYIEQISDADIKDLEMLFGEVVIYNLDNNGHMISKEIRKIETEIHA